MCGYLLFLPSFMYLPAFIFAYIIIESFFHLGIWRLLSRFLTVWALFFLLVGTGRFLAGVSIHSLVADFSYGLGLAIGVSCAVFLFIKDKPSNILSNFDAFKISRTISYAFIALLRLQSKVKTSGSLQLHLLKLKQPCATNLVDRVLAYRRVVGPLFTLLLAQQYVHASSLSMRGFFDSRPSYLGKHPSSSALRFLSPLILLLFNLIAWHRLSKWILLYLQKF
jgi:hypothetical protein